MPPKRFVFSKSKIETLRPHPTKRLHFKDTGVAGLGLRLQPSGHRSFNWFRKVAGQPTFKLIGTFPQVSVEQARKIASDFNSKLNTWQANSFDGADPFQRRVQVTVGHALDDYCDRHLKVHAKDPSCAVKVAQDTFARHAEAWRDRRLASIQRQDVIELHRKIGDARGFYAANRTVQLLRRVFNWASGYGNLWQGVNPCARVKLFREESRERYLQPEEMPRLFQALGKTANADLRDFVLLGLFVGARRGNILGMRWEDVDLGRGLWMLSAREMKNRAALVLPLIPEAVQVLLERRRRVGDGPWVFPSRAAGGHILDLKRGWKRLLAEARITNFRIHDLRRTAGSWMAAQGSSLQTIGKVLGHRSLEATSVYARLDVTPARAAIANAAASMLAAGGKAAGKAARPKLLGAPRG